MALGHYVRWARRGSSLVWRRISDEAEQYRIKRFEKSLATRDEQRVVSSHGRRFVATPSPYVTATEWQTRVLKRVITIMDAALPGEFFLASARTGGKPRIAVTTDSWRELPEILALPDLVATTPSHLGVLDRWGRIGQLDHTHIAGSIFVLFSPICNLPNDSTFVHGPEAGVLIESWHEVGDELFPVSGRSAPRVNVGTVTRNQSIRTRGLDAPMPTSLAQPEITEVTFPIDAVYTWVDGADQVWRARRDQYLREQNPGAFTEASADESRFTDHQELRYSLRSIEQYAPWIHHVYIVTAGQRPAWLVESHPRLTVIDHKDIFPPEIDALPTFNSHAIESVLHRIPGLAEHFLYLNDDVLFSSPTTPETFFAGNGIARFSQSRAQIADGEPRADEPASDSSGKNARALLLHTDGRRINRKLFHTPLALQKSIAEQLWEEFPEEAERTAQARFRTIEDFQFAGNLHLHFAYSRGKATIGRIRYRYVDVGASTAPIELQRLYDARHELSVYCLNEASTELPATQIERELRGFLERMHPNVSSFEIAPR